MRAARPSRTRRSLGELQADIERRLRTLLREHRRRLGDPSFDDAEKEEADIKDLQRRLRLFEEVLNEEPPDEDFVEIFEELLRQLQKSIDDFEEKLHTLGEEEARKRFLDPPELPSERYIKLLHSFEEVLLESAGLLTSFEHLLHRFKTPPDAAMFSFENLLKGFAQSLKSFEDLLGAQLAFPLPDEQRFLDSFWKLLRELENLLGSFEGLIKAQKPTVIGLVTSFSELLGGPLAPGLAELLESFAGLIQSHIPHDPDFNLSPEDEALISHYETLLHGDEMLLASFAGLVREHVAKNLGLLKEFEDRLADLEARLGDFEKMINDFAPRKKPLIMSFELLLHELVKLLTTFHGILKDKAPKNAERIESFEGLIRSFEQLLDSFEGLLDALPAPDPELVGSFEKLVHDLADLIESFEARRRGATFPNPDRVARSNKDLNDGLQKLQASLERLKKRFQTLPPELQQSDVRVADETLTRLEVFPRGLRRPSAEEADEFTRSVVYGAKALLALCQVLLRDRPLDPRVVADFRKVVSRQRRLVAATRSAFKRHARSSVFLQEALEDAAWLQTQLEERARQL